MTNYLHPALTRVSRDNWSFLRRAAWIVVWVTPLFASANEIKAPDPQNVASLLEKAESGDKDAMFALGERHELGQGTTVDARVAAGWHRKAAELGHPGAMRSLGLMYEDGRGVARDYISALAWYRLAADAPHSTDGRAMNNLGLLHSEGLGVRQDFAKALEWFRKSAEKGDPGGMINLAQAYTTAEGNANPQEAARWYAKARETYQTRAATGDASAMLRLATIYEHGQGLKADAKQAAAWCRQAAELGRPDAMLRWALLHRRGVGVPQDDRQFLRWCQKAADAGRPDAMLLLAATYAAGGIVPQDEPKALDLCRAAAERGHGLAMRVLAEFHENGIGTPKDEKQSVAWYSKAAAWGDPESMTRLGIRYNEGKGVPKDERLAAVQFRKAAELNDPRAAYYLGLAYTSGRGVARDDVAAFRWFNKAAYYEHAGAIYKLGVMNAEGRGVTLDAQQASFWYRVAARLGDPDAKRALASGDPKSVPREPTAASESTRPERSDPARQTPAAPRSVVAKVLSEKDLKALIELRVPDSAVRSRIQKTGVAAEVDEAALERLKKAGASAALLAAVREAVATKNKPATVTALTYQDVLQLLSLGVDEQAILRRHVRSPTNFSLNDEQIQKLKEAGASPKLLSVLSPGAGGGDESSKPTAKEPGPSAESTVKGWGEVIDSEGDSKFSLEQDTLTITVPGVLRDLWPGKGKVNAPLVLQDVAGDFVVEVSVVRVAKAQAGTVLSGLASTASFHAGTLVIWQDSNNFVRFDRTDMHNKGQAVTSCYLHVFQNGERTAEVAEVLPDKPTQLRLARRGGQLAASYSLDGAKTWKSLAVQRVELPERVKVGVTALNNTSQPASATFKGLKLSTDK